MKNHKLVASVIILGLFSGCSGDVSAASLEKAEMLSNHGLTREAKLELIEVIHSRSADNEKASAHYPLGPTAFEDNSISAALE